MPIVDLVGNRYAIRAEQPHFGLEIEVEDVYDEPNTEGTGWTHVGDGSLRNGGLEFLSMAPRNEVNILRDVRAWYEWYAASDWSAGIRCSTHVHVNVLGHSVQKICASSVLYTLLEPLLYRYCGPIREENIYCVPWYRARDELIAVREAIQSDDFRMFGMTCKYSGLYLHPIQRFGTMEFRMAPVFDTADELLDWIEICKRIVYSAYDTADQVLEDFQQNSADDFVKFVLGDHLTRVLRDACEQPFEDLLDKYDVETNAEIALASTYQPKGSWAQLVLPIEGEGAYGYHRMRHHPEPQYFVEPDFYNEEEEYREYGDEEEDY